MPVGRTVVVLAVFVAAAVVLLGGIHGMSTGVSTGVPGPLVKSTHNGSGGTRSGTSTGSTRPAVPVTTTTTTTTTTRPRANVPVLVANGTTVTGAAGAISNQLHGTGWDLLAPVNATAKVTSSAVYYASGLRSSAVAIAAQLNLSSRAVAPLTSAVPVSSVGSAQVVVIVGADIASAAVSGTTTTASSATRTG